MPVSGHDVHSHHPGPRPPGLWRLRSLDPEHDGPLPPDESGPVSLGLHPWYLPADPRAALQRLEEALDDPRVAAVGEAGLDTRRGPDAKVQLQALAAQAEFAEARALPLILHVVRAWSPVLRLRRQQPWRTPWILHGYRGGLERALPLVDAGFHLSFGAALLRKSDPVREVFRALPPDRLLLETDDDALDFAQLESEATALRGVPLPVWRSTLARRIEGLFPAR